MILTGIYPNYSFLMTKSYWLLIGLHERISLLSVIHDTPLEVIIYNSEFGETKYIYFQKLYPTISNLYEDI
jgi:hypothetical protein